LNKPRIVSVKETKTAEAAPTQAPEPRPQQPQPRAEPVKPANGPPWVQRDLIEARKKGLPKAAEEIIEQQARDILPTIPEPGQPFNVGEKKPLSKRLFGWLFK